MTTKTVRIVRLRKWGRTLTSLRGGVKLLWVLAMLVTFAAIAPPQAQAQCSYVTVSGTVTDPNGLPWSNGTIEAQVVPSTGTISCTGGGQVLNYTRASLDSTGSFSFNVAANSSISPGGSQWQFTVHNAPIPAPLGTGPQTIVYTATINSNTVLSTAISALAPSIVVTTIAGSPQKSAATNFGTVLATQTIVAAGSNPAPSNVYTINFYQWQSLAGAGCGAGSNTVTPTLAWTGPGGNAQTLALTALTVSANGTVDTFQQQGVTIATSPGTAITYTTASALASAGCSPVPQYTVYVRAIP